MHLVFIYGPPAVGKFTVGTALAKLTGFGFFHNHLTVDAVRPIFDDSDERRGPLLKEMRLTAIQHAAEGGKDIIFSLAYSGAVDDEWVQAVADEVVQHKGDVHFVQLYAPPEILHARVISQSRREMGKISTPEEMKHALATRDHYATFKHSDHLTIDTSTQPPEESAKQIAAHFALTIGR